MTQDVWYISCLDEAFTDKLSLQLRTLSTSESLRCARRRGLGRGPALPVRAHTLADMTVQY